MKPEVVRTFLLLASLVASAASKPLSKVSNAAPDPKVLTLSNVVVLYRHGDRTPIDTYPNDPYKDPKLWPVGFGQLTPKGKMMQYHLGQYLRQRYQDFLPEAYSERDIFVRSTDIDRTLMSAYSNLAGLYPPTGNQIWNPEIPWQPIPVHTLPDNEDNLLSSHADCPRLNYLVDHINDLPEIKEINDKYDWVYKYLTEKTGANITSMQHVDYIFDTLYIQQLYNLTLPDWTEKVYPEPMNYLRDLSFQTTTWTDEMKRLRAGPLIQTILEYFEVTANASDIRPKFMMYSGHDTSISCLLNALGMFDPPIAPPYASMVIVELFYRDIDEQHFVRFSYRNETDRDPFVLKLFGSGCDEFCPLEEFGRLTQHLRPQNWTAECRAGMAIDDPTIIIITEFSIAVASFLLLVLVIAVVVSCCVRRDRKDSSGKYQSVNQDYR